MLQVSGLRKHFELAAGHVGKDPVVVRAVEDVSFAIDKGETLTIVGESGCGKSTIAKMLVGLVAPTAGTVEVAGRMLSPDRTQDDRRLIQLVSQNPWSALNRRRTLRHALEQPLLAHGIGRTKADRARLVGEMVERVGLTDRHLGQLPAGVSGGELARAVLARALLLSPQVLVLDEPTASLDVSVKATVVNLLLDLRAELGLSMVLITHELDIARKLADKSAVMYLGRIVEQGSGEQVFDEPRHPYTRMLLASMPVADPEHRRLPEGLGEVASAIAPPPGCAYHPRCAYAEAICGTAVPELLLQGDRMLACHRADELGLPSEVAAAHAAAGVPLPLHASSPADPQRATGGRQAYDDPSDAPVPVPERTKT